MNRTIKYIIPLLLILSAFASCSRTKVIPDSTLKEIFKEIYLTNAYFNSNAGITTDSLDTYRPILKKYGFTTKDFENTIVNFSRRKSSRLSDVLEGAISELQNEYNFYEGRVAVLDTIDVRAGRMFMRNVYFDSLISVQTIKDTAKLRLSIPVEPGTYRISYNYMFDTADKNTGLRTTLNFVDTRNRRNTLTTNWMTMRRPQTYTVTLEAKETDSLLNILFANYQKEMKKPHLTIDSLVIDYYLPKEVALDSVNRIIFKQLLPEYEQYLQVPQDSSALRLLEPGPDSLGPDLR